MNYALIENNIVTNIIWLYPGNASDFPNAVPMNDIPAGIGDEYIDGKFYRDGEELLTQLDALIKKSNSTIAALDVALVEATYNNLVEE